MNDTAETAYAFSRITDWTDVLAAIDQDKRGSLVLEQAYAPVCQLIELWLNAKGDSQTSAVEGLSMLGPGEVRIEIALGLSKEKLVAVLRRAIELVEGAGFPAAPGQPFTETAWEVCLDLAEASGQGALIAALKLCPD